MNTFYFYDLETSGFNPKTQRIMQFAGQRTTLDLQPIGEPDDILIKLDKDVLPDPEAILVTGITPQRTHLEGITEESFCRYFEEYIATPNTIFVGYNTIRFDDEFMRYLFYRNLRDPYEWQWKEGRSRWDLLDVVRMTRALRPHGIQWPVTDDGTPVNKLELLTKANNLEHTHAHNALSDVVGSIAVARLIKDHAPKLFNYLLEIRGKNEVSSLLSREIPLVYSSGSFLSEYEKTTIVMPLGQGEEKGSTLVFDLRYDPEKFLELDPAIRDFYPIKNVRHNKCPAIAPINVVDDESWTRIGLNKSDIEKHVRLARKNVEKLRSAYSPREFENTQKKIDLSSVDGLLYEGFIPDTDKKIMDRIHRLNDSDLIEFDAQFQDERLKNLYFLYRARQFPKSLLADERQQWEEYIRNKLIGSSEPLLKSYMERLSELAREQYLDADKRYILEELALYGQSVVPLDSD